MIAAVVATVTQSTETVERIATPGVDWWALAPILVMIGGAMVLLVLDALSLKKPGPTIHTLFTVLVAGAAIVAATALWQEVRDPAEGPYSIMQGALGIDAFSVFFFVLLPVAVILAALLADGYLRREQLEGPELYVLLLLSAAQRAGRIVLFLAQDRKQFEHFAERLLDAPAVPAVDVAAQQQVLQHRHAREQLVEAWAFEQFQRGETKAVQIEIRTKGPELAAQQFGRQVFLAPSRNAQLAVWISLLEITQLHLPGIVDQDIRWADLAVNLASIVQEIQCP